MLKAAWNRITRYADPLRKELLSYGVGDAVMLSTQNLKLKRPIRKLGNKFPGPFQVEKVISPSAA